VEHLDFSRCANITNRFGASFLSKVRKKHEYYSDPTTTFFDKKELARHEFLLQQWREIEVMLVVRGALDDNRMCHP
jgi:hypothetical protein